MRIMDGFVDDTTNWVNNFISSLTDHEPQMLTIAARLRESAQHWEQLLYSSGGALELEKCFYYLICWIFDDHVNPVLHEISLPAIEIQSSVTNSNVTIKRLSCTTPHRTLSIQLQPDCNPRAEKDRLHQKAIEFARQITAANLTRNQARMVYRSIYRGRMEYGLTASTLEPRDYHFIESPAIRALLPKLGYARSTSLPIVHDPYELGGIGLQDLYSSQGAKKILALLSHIRCGRTLGRMLQLDIQWTQHALGVCHNILQEPTKPIPPSIGDTWTRSVRHFCIDTGCSVLIPSIRPPAP
jgi:hypothetical protein